MRWFFPSTYNIAGLFVIISLLALVLAWNSYGLLMLAMANLDYLHRVGVMGALDGGLLQLSMISGKALISLLCYIGFKGIESELVHRWLNWRDK